MGTAAGENAILRGTIAELADENEKLRAENERLSRVNAELLAGNRMLQLEIRMQQKLLRLAREGDTWNEDQLVPRKALEE